jgi:hypothetical protein
MKTFWKYAGLAVGIQILLCAAAIAIANLSAGHNSIIGVLLIYFYFPTIALIGALGNYKGESAMIDPIIYGMPLGILIYGIITGAIFSYFKRDRKPERSL